MLRNVEQRAQMQNFFRNFTPVLKYLCRKMISSVKSSALYERSFLPSELSHSFGSWPSLHRLKDVRKNKELASGAMISMQPSDSEPACISKRHRLRNKQSDSRFSLLSINVVCGHVPHWKHLLNWQLRLPNNSVFWNLCSPRQDVQVCVWWSSIIFIAATHCAKHKSNPQRTISGGGFSESFAPGSVWKTNAPVWAWRRHIHTERTHAQHRHTTWRRALSHVSSVEDRK